MAQLDVSDLLLDPDFVDPIQVIIQVPTVNSLGENTTNDTVINTIGSIQPATAREILRLPEELRVVNMSSFWVKGTLSQSGAGRYPSVLVFKGNRYQIKSVVDWSAWGGGYSEGIAVMEQPS